MRKLLTALALAGATAGLLPAQPNEPPAPDRLIQALGDPDFATRERATAGLRALGPPVIPMVERALTSDDPEVRRRAAALLPALKAQAAIDPRLVTLRRGPVDLADALADITKQTGYALTYHPVKGKEPKYDFGPAELTFWEAVERVAERSNRAVSANESELGVHLARSRSRAPFVSLDGAFRLELTRVHENRDINFTEPGAGGAVGERWHRLSFHFSVLAEPRFLVLATGPVRFTAAVDDADGKLTPPPGDDDERSNTRYSFESSRADFHQSACADLLRSPKNGSKVRALAGVVPVRVVVERKRVVVPNFRTAGDKEIKVGNQTLVLMRAEIDGDGDLDVSLQVPRDPDSDRHRWQQRVSIEDVWGNKLQPNSTGSGSNGVLQYITVGWQRPRGWFNAYSPNLVIEDWVVVEKPVRFAFRDVPLP